MGPYFEGGVSWCSNGFLRIQNEGPIPGDHRICFGGMRKLSVRCCCRLGTEPKTQTLLPTFGAPIHSSVSCMMKACLLLRAVPLQDSPAGRSGTCTPGARKAVRDARTFNESTRVANCFLSENFLQRPQLLSLQTLWSQILDIAVYHILQSALLTGVILGL